MPLPKLLKRRDNGASANPADGSPVDSEAEGRLEKPAGEYDQTPVRFLRLRILAMALIVSMGGLIFGYDTGQISGSGVGIAIGVIGALYGGLGVAVAFQNAMNVVWNVNNIPH